MRFAIGLGPSEEAGLEKTLDPTWEITPEYVGIKKGEETYTYVQCAKGGCFAQELIMTRQSPPQ